jgi:hypothetical protein
MRTGLFVLSERFMYSVIKCKNNPFPYLDGVSKMLFAGGGSDYRCRQVKKYPPLPSISCLSGSIEGRQERI